MKTAIKTLIYLLISSLCTVAIATPQQPFKASPITNSDKPWRIGYYEGGPYIEYQKVLTATVKGLMDLCWIETQKIPNQEGEQTDALWKWLTTNLNSDYIEFVNNGHYSAGWEDESRENLKQQVIQRLAKKQDIDLMIAMGTWAGQDLANNKHSTNTLILSSSDPIASGIIKSIDNSGFKHVHATVDPDRYERQLRVFHDITGFKKLGIAYEDTQNGRSYAAMDTIKSLSEEIGFSIVPCHTKSDIKDIRFAEHSVVRCFQQLVETADAIYVTEQGGVTKNTLPVLVQTANRHHIPTFSQSGSEEVKHGILASLSQANFKFFGEFHATTAAQIFNGAKPSELNQHFKEPPRMAVNLKTAEIIGFNPPLLLLGASDEIYQEITQPK